MSEFLLAGIATIVALGVIAQWIAWRFRLPSILLFLLTGFLAGPITGVLNPDVLFGEMLSPLVALSAATLLLEGGLGLSFAEMARVGPAVRNLVTVGALITCLGSAVAAHFITGLSVPLSILLGAVVVISGPTVIVPLLRDMPLRGQLGSVVRWEGISNEPMGVALSVLAFAGAMSRLTSTHSSVLFGAITKTFFVGAVIGIVISLALVAMLRSRQVPDFLKNPIALMAMAVALAVSGLMAPASGLIAVTLMGIILANQRIVNVTQIIEFRETLKLILVPVLFIMLAARLDRGALNEFSLNGFLFLASLIFVVRPLAVFIAALGTDLTFREKLFLSCIAPRGFVAAAMSSLLALDLIDSGYPEADRLVPLTFLVIIGTVAAYGLGTPLLARLLNVAESSPQGVLILGAHDWARQIARALLASGFRVLAVDTNQYNILAARREGVPARHANVVVDRTLDDVVLEGVGCFLALTANNEVNTLASLHFSELFGSESVFQLPIGDLTSSDPAVRRQYRHGMLFGAEATFDSLDERVSNGEIVRTIELSRDVTLETIREQFGSSVTPLFAITKNGQFLPFLIDAAPPLVAGTRLICLGDPKVFDSSDGPSGSRIVFLDPKNRNGA